MATAFLGTSAKAGIAAQQSIREDTVVGKYAVLVALVINDTIDMCQLPANCFITSIWVNSTDLDTNVAPAILFDVQLKTATTKYITGSLVGQAAGSFSWPAVSVAATGGTIGQGGLLITAADTLQLLVATAPATGVAGTIYWAVKYTSDVKWLL